MTQMIPKGSAKTGTGLPGGRERGNHLGITWLI